MLAFFERHPLVLIVTVHEWTGMERKIVKSTIDEAPVMTINNRLDVVSLVVENHGQGIVFRVSALSTRFIYEDTDLAHATPQYKKRRDTPPRLGRNVYATSPICLYHDCNETMPLI